MRTFDKTGKGTRKKTQIQNSGKILQGFDYFGNLK